MLNILKSVEQFFSTPVFRYKSLKIFMFNDFSCFVKPFSKMSSSSDSNKQNCDGTTSHDQSSLCEPCDITLVACGSFNPITYMHLRMFELAKDYLNDRFPKSTVKSGFLSPVGDGYGKPELVNGKHRKEMCRMAISTSSWIEVKTWELDQKEWKPTAEVLTNYETLIQQNGSKKGKILYLCGSDLLKSFSTKGLWLEADIRKIVGHFGTVVVTRPSFNVDQIILQSALLSELKHNIFVVSEQFTNDVSSTKVREAIQQKKSIRYLVPDQVAEYIDQHNLYAKQPPPVADELAPFKLYRSKQ